MKEFLKKFTPIRLAFTAFLGALLTAGIMHPGQGYFVGAFFLLWLWCSSDA
jgi:hypothetical protein